MDQIMKIEVLASIGALAISTGSFVYLNNKVSLTEESLKSFSEKFNTMIYKINDLDDKNRISKVGLDELKESLSKFNNNFTELKSDMTDNFILIEQVLEKQNKKFKSIEKKIQLLAQNMDIEIPEENEMKHKQKKQIHQLNNHQLNNHQLNTHQLKQSDKRNKSDTVIPKSSPGILNKINKNNIAKVSSESDDLEEDVLNQMTIMGL